jgi:hypothetical protein
MAQAEEESTAMVLHGGHAKVALDLGYAYSPSCAKNTFLRKKINSIMFLLCE